MGPLSSWAWITYLSISFSISIDLLVNVTISMLFVIEWYSMGYVLCAI